MAQETVAILSVGATLLIGMIGIGVGLGGLIWKTAESLAADIRELRVAVQDLDRRVSRIEGHLGLASQEPT